MGRGILIVVLGLGIIITILEFNLNANTTQGLSTTTSYYDANQARLISNSGIDIYLEKMVTNKSLSGGTFTNNTLMGGSYDIYIWGQDTLLNIKSIATFNNVSHTTLVTAKRAQVQLPKVSSSVYIQAQTVGINFGGNLTIDGNDHQIGSTSANGTGTPLPGIGLSPSIDSTTIIDNIKSKVTGDITGAGGATPNVEHVNNTIDWNAMTQSIVASADNTIASGTYSGNTFGTDASPQVTYATGDVHFSGTVTGSGIMVVNGNLTLSGQFTFDGIIIVYGTSQITVQSTGQATVYGATMLIGSSVLFQPAAGKAAFYYSSSAISNAQVKLKSTQFKILSWWE